MGFSLMNKSFLLLFFKKEVLSFCNPDQEAAMPEADDALALEFEVMAKRAGLTIPEKRRPGLFAGFKDIRQMAALLRQPRTAASEPAATFDILTVTRSLQP